MARTWREKHDNHKRSAQIETLSKPFAGLPRGARIVIATPKEMSAYFRSVPRGKTRTMAQLRDALARRYAVDAACPMTTGIFCRIAAEFAYEQLQMGAKKVAPFWRVIDPSSPLAKKLSCGPDFIRKQRHAEGIVGEAAGVVRRSTKA